MVTKRYLGAGYTAVHGPLDPIARVHWLLDQGFGGCEVAPAARAVDWSATGAAMGGTPAEFCGVRVESPLDARREPLCGLATGNRGELAAMRQRVGDACALAARLGVQHVVLEAGAVAMDGERGRWDLGDPGAGWDEASARAQLARRKPGRDRAVDQLCRNLWAVLRELPDFRFSLCLTRDVAGVLDPQSLEWVLEDLGGSGRLGYWHDAPVAALRARWLGEDQGVWLEDFGDRTVGLTVGDPWDGGTYGPPGTGFVDYPLVASYLGGGTRSAPVVVELDAAVPRGELQGVLAFLDKIGL